MGADVGVGVGGSPDHGEVEHRMTRARGEEELRMTCEGEGEGARRTYLHEGGTLACLAPFPFAWARRAGSLGAAVEGMH